MQAAKSVASKVFSTVKSTATKIAAAIPKAPPPLISRTVIQPFTKKPIAVAAQPTKIVAQAKTFFAQPSRKPTVPGITQSGAVFQPKARIPAAALSLPGANPAMVFEQPQNLNISMPTDEGMAFPLSALASAGSAALGFAQKTLGGFGGGVGGGRGGVLGGQITEQHKGFLKVQLPDGRKVWVKRARRSRGRRYRGGGGGNRRMDKLMEIAMLKAVMK